MALVRAASLGSADVAHAASAARTAADVKPAGRAPSSYSRAPSDPAAFARGGSGDVEHGASSGRAPISSRRAPAFDRPSSDPAAFALPSSAGGGPSPFPRAPSAFARAPSARASFGRAPSNLAASSGLAPFDRAPSARASCGRTPSNRGGGGEGEEREGIEGGERETTGYEPFDLASSSGLAPFDRAPSGLTAFDRAPSGIAAVLGRVALVRRASSPGLEGSEGFEGFARASSPGLARLSGPAPFDRAPSGIAAVNPETLNPEP